MSKSSIRRFPQQSRSHKRVDLILNTAAQLFTEVGYEATTTNAIAQRAGISIGSLYRYFPDKKVILSTLAERHLEKIRAIFDRVFTEDAVYLPLVVLVDRLVDPFLALHLDCPAYTHLVLGAGASPDLGMASSTFRQEVIERLTEGLLRLAPQLDEARARLVAAVCKEEVKALLSLVVASDDEQFRAQVMAEMKQMLRAYLETVLKPAASDHV